MTHVQSRLSVIEGPVVLAGDTTDGAREGTHRVIFIDLARAMAVIMMVYGHTVAALLAPAYRSGPWYDAWVFQRGLTSGLFLLLSGFAFSVATMRHWPAHVQVSPALWKRLRRFALFIVIGYGLHFPARHFGDLLTIDEPQWRSFLAVDVLQLIGVTFVAVQLLVLALKSRRAFTAAVFALAVAITAVTPALWSAGWVGSLPPGLAAYLTPSGGSQFPLFPWAAYVLIGAGAGQIYARWGAGHLAAFASWIGAAGAVLVALALSAPALPMIFGTGPLSWVPATVAMRTGACFVLLGVIAHASRAIVRLPRVFGAVAQESLLVYVAHLCVVYGSTWNDGLVRPYGEALGPSATAAAVGAVVAAMMLLAWGWNRLKHGRPRAARWVPATVGVGLIASLL